MKDVTAEWRFVNTTTASEVKGAFSGSLNTAMCVGTTTSGNVSATVVLYGAHTPSPDVWDALATFTLSSGASPQSDGVTFTSAYPFMKAECSAISGTGAQVILRVQRA